MNNIEKAFWELCLIVHDKYEKTYSTGEIEPSLLNILKFIKNNIDEREILSQCFIELLSNKGKGPFEIVVFCMRELQWQEVKDVALSEMKSTDDPRVHNVMNDILAVYESTWEDADLYSYYNT